MSRLTLRLPESLHRQLETLARREQASLNQYIVYALTRQVTQTYLVHEHSEDAVDKQRTEFVALQQKIGQTSPEALDRVLADRETVEPEEGLEATTIRRFQGRLLNRQSDSRQQERVKGRGARSTRKAG